MKAFLLASITVFAISFNRMGTIVAMKSASLKKAKTEKTASSAGAHVSPVSPVLEGNRVILSEEDVRKITAFDDVVCQGTTTPLRDYTALDLSNNKLTQLPRGFDRLTALTWLSLGNNDLKELFPERWNFPHLELLDISYTRVGQRSISWSAVSNLKRLIASNAEILDFSDTIGNLSGLTYVDLSHNRFVKINSAFFLLSAIGYLNLSYNRMRELSPMICNFNLLTELFLDENQLTSLPPHIGKLPRLRVLSLSGNKLRTLPDQFSQLKDLRVLRLSLNELTEFPQQICSLANLVHLSLDSNNLETLSAGQQEPRFDRLKALLTLSVQNNRLQSLPRSIGHLVLLQKLLLCQNLLHSLPDEIIHLRQLEELDLTGNEFESAPGSLRCLPQRMKLAIDFISARSPAS